MNAEERIAKLEELFRNNGEEMIGIFEGNDDEIIAKLAKMGIEFTEEEVSEIKKEWDNTQAKLDEILNDQENVNKVLTGDADDVLNKLKDLGINTSKEELQSLVYEKEGELTEEDLEDVAGGYCIKCLHCGKVWRNLSRVGVVAKALGHGHGVRNIVFADPNSGRASLSGNRFWV